MEKIYKKVNGRYKEIGQEWSGFPSNGVWLVKDGSQNCIMFMDEIGKKPIQFINIQKHKADVMERIYELTSKPHSTSDIVDTVLEYVSANIEHEKYI